MGIYHNAVKAHGDKGLHTEWNDDHKIQGNLDFRHYAAENMIIENRTDWPAGPAEGRVIYRTDQHTLYHWNGTSWTALVGPATVVVAADGSGMTDNIQDGIDMLPAGGGVVYIKEGTYTINASINITIDNVAIMGTGFSTIILMTNALKVFNCIGADRLTFKDFQIDGNAVGLTGIYIEDGNYCIIDGCWIHDCGDGITTSVNVGTVIDNTITNCKIYDNSANGIYLDNDSDRAVISSNHINGNTSHGIWVNHSDYVNVINNIIYDNGGSGVHVIALYDIINNNTIYENNSSGIYFVGFGYHVCNGNVIYKNERYGIMLDCSDSVCIGNLVKDNDFSNTASFDGIAVHNGDRNLVASNRCYNNDRYEINIQDVACDRTLLLGNIVRGTDHVGTINDNGTNTEIAHNVTL